ncbi:MAG: hypothetical protein KGI54_06480 [Pseudomonadota bacterium]|nr:hypothetical protein [Pseudomonadota bacterium]
MLAIRPLGFFTQPRLTSLMHVISGTVALFWLYLEIHNGTKNLFRNNALLLFCITFFLGLVMLLLRLTKQPRFMTLIVMHGLFAGLALTVLGLSLF